MYTGAVVKNKNSSSKDSKEAASKEAADTKQEERWIFLFGWV
jgi:predicted amidohydrolase YtcJ